MERDTGSQRDGVPFTAMASEDVTLPPDGSPLQLDGGKSSIGPAVKTSAKGIGYGTYLLAKGAFTTGRRASAEAMRLGSEFVTNRVAKIQERTTPTTIVDLTR